MKYLRLFSKKGKQTFVIIFTLLLLSIPTYASAELFEENGVILQINNSYVVYSHQQMPYIDQNGRTMIPFRMIGDLLDANVTWDGQKREATIEFDRVTIQTIIGNKEAWINGESYMMDTTPVIKNNTTMVPARLIADALNIPIEWDDEYKIVTLRSDKFLKVGNLALIDQMENLDNSISGKIIPTKVQFLPHPQPNANYLSIDLLNATDKVIKESQLHKNLAVYRSSTDIGASYTFGYTAPSGQTGLNTQDIQIGKYYTDLHEINWEGIPFLEQVDVKYIIVNYFKTTHGERE